MSKVGGDGQRVRDKRVGVECEVRWLGEISLFISPTLLSHISVHTYIYISHSLSLDR